MTTIAVGQKVTSAKINQWAPPGMVVDYAGATAPDGWLFCDGASYLAADYPELFTAIGVLYGTADAGVHFNVPDLRDRVSVGVGNTALAANDGVSSANRHGTRHRHTTHIHGFVLDVLSNAIGVAGGAAYQKVTATNTTANHDTGLADGGSGVATDPLDGAAYIGLNKIIRAKDV